MADLTFLNESAEQAAPRLLGCILERHISRQLLRVRIVETEAYDQADAASHSYKGKTARTAVMFGPAGHLYVYFTYGMHYCCNIVAGPAGHGAAVLIRAVEPLSGIDDMRKRRGGRHGTALTDGPAKLCQALAIDNALNGHSLDRLPLKLLPQDPLPSNQITTTTRVGISRDHHRRWRFYITGNSFVSSVAPVSMDK